MRPDSILRGSMRSLTDQPPGINQARQDVFLFQARVALRRSSEVSPAASIPNTCSTASRRPANDGFSAKDVRTHCDAFEEFLFVHESVLCSDTDGNVLVSENELPTISPSLNTPLRKQERRSSAAGPPE